RRRSCARPSPARPRAPRHVLAAVVADRLDDRLQSAVAHAEALARHAADVRLPGGRAVEGDVADDDVFLGDEGRSGRRVDDELAAREPLADVIVRIALERERHPVRQERPEALSGRAFEMEPDGILGQPRRAPAARDRAAGDRADDAVDVADRQARLHALAALDRGPTKLEELRHIERLLESVILIDLAITSHLGPQVRLIQNVAEIEAAGLPVLDGLLCFEPEI